MFIDDLQKEIFESSFQLDDENPEEMYGKIMSWPDELINIAFELCTNIPMPEIKKMMNPRNAKVKLAKEITSLFYSKKIAAKAGKEFGKVFKEKKLPTKIPEIKIKEKSLNILDLLIKTKLSSSKSEAKRLIQQKGVKINSGIEKDWKAIIEIKKGMIIQVGKRKFAKLS